MDKYATYAKNKTYGANGATRTSTSPRMVYVDTTPRTNWFIVGCAVVIALALIAGMGYMVLLAI